jgi:hypothetical protein
VFVIAAPIGLIAFLASWVPFFPLCSAFFPENPVLHAQQSKRRPAVYALPGPDGAVLAAGPSAHGAAHPRNIVAVTHLEENPAAAELVLDEVALVTLDQAACS